MSTAIRIRLARLSDSTLLAMGLSLSAIILMALSMVFFSLGQELLGSISSTATGSMLLVIASLFLAKTPLGTKVISRLI